MKKPPILELLALLASSNSTDAPRDNKALDRIDTAALAYSFYEAKTEIGIARAVNHLRDLPVRLALSLPAGALRRGVETARSLGMPECGTAIIEATLVAVRSHDQHVVEHHKTPCPTDEEHEADIRALIADTFSVFDVDNPDSTGAVYKPGKNPNDIPPDLKDLLSQIMGEPESSPKSERPLPTFDTLTQ